MFYDFVIWSNRKGFWKKEEYVSFDALTYEDARIKLTVYAREIYGDWIELRACDRSGINSFLLQKLQKEFEWEESELGFVPLVVEQEGS